MSTTYNQVLHQVNSTCMTDNCRQKLHKITKKERFLAYKLSGAIYCLSGLLSFFMISRSDKS
jgi:hypothetical protein